MGKDKFMDRFLRRKSSEQRDERARRNLPKEVVDEEQELIENTPKVDPIQADAAPGRNDPCPCGSGRKYKKCCGSEQ